MSYAERYHKEFMKILQDKKSYVEWVSKRSGIIIADSLLSNYDALEIGCGNGGNFHLMKNAKSIHAFDVNPEFVEIAKGSDIRKMLPKNINLKVELTDARDFRLEKHYDLISSVYVLFDRVNVSDAWLRNLILHLNPGGFLFVYTLVSENLSYSRGAPLSKLKKTAKKIFRNMSLDQDRFVKSRFSNLKLINEGIVRYDKGISKTYLWTK